MAEQPQAVVLVVDDDRGICTSLAMHLKYRGFAVETACCGKDGLRRLAAGGIDLVITDIGLPDLSGHEVVRRAVHLAVEKGLDRPEFIIMTANATLDHAVSALEEGACQFITKPLSMPFLEVVVKHALALRALRQQVGQLESSREQLVLQALADITGSLGLVGTLEAVLRALQLLARPTTSAIWLADQTDLQIKPVTTLSAVPEVPLDPIHEELVIECGESGHVLFRRHAEVRYAAAPVILDGRVECVVSLEIEEPDRRTDEELSEVLLTVAQYSAGAIRKERVFASLETSSMQISSLFEVGLAMSSETSLQKLFDVIVDSSARICGAERCSLMLVDKDGETLRMRAAIGIPPDIVAKAETKIGHGIAGSVAASGEPLFISNIEASGQFSRKNATDRYNNTSLVCVPIRVQDKVVGVINVNNKRSGAGFTENDLNLLTLLASQAAVAIGNAHRYQDLSEKAITDGLTGVYIRRYFDECIDRAYRNARSTGRQFSLLMIDIDYFKKVNDSHGHQTGDEALRTVAGILKQLVRDDDLVCRYGGEEFAVILSRASGQIAARVAERIRSTVAGTAVQTTEATLTVQVSIGLATVSEQYHSPEAVVRAADAALYQAKEQGRNQVVVATIDDSQAADA
ncbi:MAG: diguanylate cyclase [Fimbriimonadaceae bacterium]|nr:diguanylate cyclase [Fimbriimonadaceae bacterium]